MKDLAIFLAAVFSNVYLKALALFVASAIVAKLADWIVSLVLRRLTSRTETQLDDAIIGAMHRPIFVSIFLVGFELAVEALQLPERIGPVVHGLVLTIAVFIWMVAGFRVTTAVTETMRRATGHPARVDARTAQVLDNAVKLALGALAIYVFLMAWRLDVKPWLASAGIAGIAIGFAAKDSLANLFGGLFILADAPYKIGDYVVIDSGERGMVTKIGLRSTRIMTRDDVEITIPNAQIANAKIANESGGPSKKTRVTIRVGVAYGSDVDRVRRVLLESAAAIDEVASHPEARVRFTEFGDSSLNFRLLCWIGEPEWKGQVVDALHEAIYKNFAKERIGIPFPQRDVYIKQQA